MVIIVQENRSTDNLFNGYPGADTVASWNGHTLVPFSIAGKGCGPGHGHMGAFVPEYNNGAMDGFAQCTYAKVPASEGQPVYWALAQMNGVLLDEVPQSNAGPSFVAHQYLVGGQSGGWDMGGILDLVHTQATENGNNGDQTGGDAKGATCYAGNPSTVSQVDVTAPYPGDESVTLQSHCRDFPVITDLLDAAHVSWKYYSRSTTSNGNIWCGVCSIQHVMSNPADAARMDVSGAVLTDIANGTLPQVAFVTPYKGNSDHPGQAKVAMNGSGWISAIVNAIGQGPYWNSTTILVTWDDWGGWFDHVTPQFIGPNEYGFRVPLVVAGPYVKHVVVDHTRRNQMGAILRYIESTFALPSLGTDDSHSDDLMGLCGTDSPLCPPVVDPSQSPAPYHGPLPSYPFDTSD